MARYYKIVVGPGPSGNAGATWTNRVNGAADPGAQLVELDIPSAPFAAPAGFGYIKIWGVSLQQISQAADFNNAPISVYVGMQEGLPLATATVKDNQQGLVLQGKIFQAFGNWMGINQTLDFVVQTDGGATQTAPANLVLNWKKGTTLATAIKNTLATGYPTITPDIRISENLVLPQDEPGYYQTVEQFAQYVKAVSQSILTVDYPGVDIVLSQNKFLVYDATSAAEPTEIKFQDLIGQPTWLGAYKLSFNTVMRADIVLGDFIQFPALSALQTTTTQQSQSQARDKATFQGVFNVSYVRHVGNSRAPNAQSWITNFQCVASGAPDSTGGTSA